MDTSTPFIQSGLASLRQPATVAVLASLGIHGLFAVNIERISLFPRTAKLPPSVELVELSPDQISGIYPPPPPQFGLSNIAPPPSLSSIFGGGPTIPEFPLSPPPPPASPSFGSAPQEFFIPANPSVRSSRGSNLPSVVETYPDNSYSFGTLPPSVNIPTYTPPPPSINTFPFENNFPDQNPVPSDRNSDELDRTREFYEQLQRGEIVFSQGPDILSQSDILNPPRMGDEPGNEPPRFLPEKGPDDLAMAPGEEPSEMPPEEFRGSILQNLQQGSQAEPQTNPTTPNNPTFRLQPPPEQREQPPQGEVSNREMAMLEGGSLYVQWVLAMRESYPDVESAQSISVSNVYPAEACEQQLSGRALVGVLVGAGGEVVSGPELLLDTGYPILDNTAIDKVQEIVATQSLGRGTPTAYQYAFNFNSENCGRVSSPEEVAPEAAPENVQSVPNNNSLNNSSNPAIADFEDVLENSFDPSEDVETLQNLEPEMIPEPDEALEMPPQGIEQEMIPEPDEVFTETEPQGIEQEMIPEPVEEFIETEPQDIQQEMIPEPVEEFIETEPQDIQQEMMPSQFFEEPLEVEMPGESEEFME